MIHMLCFYTKKKFSTKALYFLKNQNEPKPVYKKHTLHLTKNLLLKKKIANNCVNHKTHKKFFITLKNSYYSFLQNLYKNQNSIFSLFFFIIQKDLMYNDFDYSIFF